MNYFKSKVKEIQDSYAYNSEYKALDYGMINNAEWEAEEKARLFASEKGLAGSFEIWEDGVTSTELDEESKKAIEEEYIKAYETELERILNS